MNPSPGAGAGSLGGKAARGGAALVVSQAARTVFQLGSLAILARILSPEDFGLFSMTAAVLRFFAVFATFGLIQAVIQRDSISREEVDGLFWLNTGLGLLFGLAVFLSAPFVAAFYENAAVEDLAKVLSLSIMLQGIGLQSRAMLERDFKFMRVVAVELVAAGLAMGAAIWMALQGAGVWALVGQDLVMVGVSSLGFLALSAWKPGLPSGKIRLAPYLRYGSGLTGANLVNYLSRNMDNVLIGRAFGGTELGFYQKAYSLVLLPINQLNAPLSRVLLPALSRKKVDPAAYREAYRQAIGCLSAISIPVIAAMGVVSHEIILLLLGPEWAPANRYFLALLPAAFIGATNMGTGWVYTSFGHTGRQMKWSVLNAVVFIIGIVLSSRFSTFTVAVTVSGMFVCFRIPAIKYCFSGTPLRERDFWDPVLRQTFVCVLAALSIMGLQTLSPVATEVVTAIVSTTVKILVFLIVLFLADFIVPGSSIRQHIRFIAIHFKRPNVGF